MEKNKYQAPAVEKLLDILEHMVNNYKGYTVTEISHELKISSNSVFRIFAELERKQYLVRNESNSSYSLTPKLYYLGSAVKGSFDYISASKPFLKELAMKTNETTQLTALDDSKNTIVVDQFESIQPIKCSSTVGLAYPSYVSSMGKIMLAYLPENEIEEYISKTHFAKYTENTITNPDVFLKELQLAKEEGLAYDREESILGLVCIAAPVFSAGGKLLGAIGTTGLSFRMNDKMEELGIITKDVARRLSESFGYIV